jgi:hypothetical protein
MKALVLFGLPFLGLICVIIFIIGIFLTDTPRNTRDTSLRLTASPTEMNKPLIGNLRKSFGRVVIDSTIYDPLKIPITNATLMNDGGEVISLLGNSEGESKFSYLPDTKTLIEHIDDQNHHYTIGEDSSLDLYRERGTNRIIIATGTNKVLVDEKGIPLRFKLMAKKV